MSQNESRSDEIAKLQQELALALERFVAASKETQRKLVELHHHSITPLELAATLAALAHKEDKAMDTYVQARKKLKDLLKRRPAIPPLASR